MHIKATNQLKEIWGKKEIDIKHWSTMVESEEYDRLIILQFKIIKNSNELTKIIKYLEKEYNDEIITSNCSEVLIMKKDMDAHSKWNIWGTGLTHMGNDCNYEDTVKILSSQEKFIERFKEIQEVFPEVKMVNAGYNCGYGVYSIQLGTPKELMK